MPKKAQFREIQEWLQGSCYASYFVGYTKVRVFVRSKESTIQWSFRRGEDHWNHTLHPENLTWDSYDSTLLALSAEKGALAAVAVELPLQVEALTNYAGYLAESYLEMLHIDALGLGILWTHGLDRDHPKGSLLGTSFYRNVDETGVSWRLSTLSTRVCAETLRELLAYFPEALRNEAKSYRGYAQKLFADAVDKDMQADNLDKALDITRNV